jgi:hypothetical protein
MQPDEVAKDVRLGLIASLRDLLSLYESEKTMAEMEIRCTESGLSLLRNKLSILESSASIARVRMLQLGAKDIKEFK